MTVKGEAIYKAAERIQKYGVEAFVKMLGEKAIKARGGRARLLKYYAEKYPSALLKITPKAPYISRSQLSYWKDVKKLSEAKGLSIKKTRTLLKRLKTAKNVQVRVIKSGEGWQLVMLGIYKNIETKEEAKEEGHSNLHYGEDINIFYEEALNECIREALNTLGGAMFGDGYADIEDSNWFLLKILKETWIRYYGRE